MKLFLKIFLVALLLGFVFALGFELWGGMFEQLFCQTKCVKWFAEIKSYAWAVGIGLLLADILLPVPATGIMAALGSVYGFWGGAFFSVIGSAGAGAAGYLPALFFGEKGAGLLATDDEIKRFQIFFDKWGGAAIIISRIMPILPEIISILAGLAGMNPARFFAALFLFA